MWKTFTVNKMLSEKRIQLVEDIDYHISTDMVEAIGLERVTIKQPVRVVSIDTHSISETIRAGYSIREFHRDYCIMELNTEKIKG